MILLLNFSTVWILEIMGMEGSAARSQQSFPLQIWANYAVVQLPGQGKMFICLIKL